MSGEWGVGRAVSRATRMASLILALATPSSHAQSPTPDTSRPTPALSDSALDAQTRSVAQGLRCPVCQGESIDASPSDLAVELKSVVREQLAAGRTPDEVRAYFVARYGEWILLKPQTGGNAAVYLLPPVLLLLGGGLIVVLLRRWTRGSAGGANGNGVPAFATDDDDVLEAEPR